MRKNCTFLPSFLFLSIFTLLFATTVHAVTHTSSYKVPLQPSSEDCGTDEFDDTSNCTGTGADFVSDFTFDRGTLQIDSNGRVGLKIDEIQVRKGESCPGSCSCYNTNTDCTDWNDCGSDSCVLDEGEIVTVEIWAQGWWDALAVQPSPCDTEDCSRRVGFGVGGADHCHDTFDFEVDDVRGGINDLLPLSNKFQCGDNQAGVIRRMEVLIDDDSDGTAESLAARPAFNHDVDLNWED